MLNNLYVGDMNVCVPLDEVIGEDGSKGLRRVDWVLLCHDVCRLLLRVCWHHYRVVRFCVSAFFSAMIEVVKFHSGLRGLDITFQHGIHGKFIDILHAIFSFLNLVDTDIVLAVLGIANLRHDRRGEK